MNFNCNFKCISNDIIKLTILSANEILRFSDSGVGQLGTAMATERITRKDRHRLWEDSARHAVYAAGFVIEVIGEHGSV